MKAQAIKQMCKKAFDELVKTVEQGKSEQLKAYLKVMGKFSRYSFRNIILIQLQKPDATQVAGFWKWKQMGRSVKKGAKGIAILAPIVYREKRPQEKDEEDDIERDIVRNFKTAYVFDIQDTQGEALPQFSQVKGDPGIYLDRLKSFIESKGIQLQTKPLYGATQGYSAGGLIVIKSDLAKAECMSTLVHELAHSLIHRDLQAKQLDRKIKEIEAEAISYVVCSAIDLELNSAHADYLQLYQGDKEKLLNSLARIQMVAAEILEAITQENRIKVAAKAA